MNHVYAHTCIYLYNDNGGENDSDSVSGRDSVNASDDAKTLVTLK